MKKLILTGNAFLGILITISSLFACEADEFIFPREIGSSVIGNAHLIRTPYSLSIADHERSFAAAKQASAKLVMPNAWVPDDEENYALSTQEGWNQVALRRAQQVKLVYFDYHLNDVNVKLLNLYRILYIEHHEFKAHKYLWPDLEERVEYYDGWGDSGLLKQLTNPIIHCVPDAWNHEFNIFECLQGMDNFRGLCLWHSYMVVVNWKPFRYFRALEELDAGGAALCDKDLTNLSGLRNLRVLRLGETLITNSGLKHLRKLVNLEELDLSHTHGPRGLGGVTDAGLKHLQSLVNLQVLNLSRNIFITDAGMPDINKLPKLREIDLSSTKISEGYKEELRKRGIKVIDESNMLKFKFYHLKFINPLLLNT